MNRHCSTPFQILLLAAIVMFSACTTQTTTELASNQLESMDSIAADFYEDYIKLHPLDATVFGDDRYNDQLPNTLTASFREQIKDLYGGYKRRLEALNYDSLSDKDKISYDVLMWDCDLQLEGLKFKNHLMPINQFSSFNLYFSDHASGSGAVPFKTVKDYNNWLSRLSKYVEWCDTAMANMKKGIKEGYVLPKVLVAKAIPQWTSMAQGPPESHLFYTPITKIPADFSNEDKTRLAAAYKKIIADKVIPVHQRMAKFLSEDYLTSAPATTGIDKIPDGRAYYDYLVKYHTTTDISADSVFELGKKEVERILEETAAVMKGVNYKGDLKSFFSQLRTKKELTPFKTPEEVLANFNAIHDRMKPNLKRLFRNTPKSAFEVRRTPSYREASASAEYLVGSEDGTRPGVFYVPIPDPAKYNVMRDEDLFLHEAIPGHHYQLSLQMENKSLPKFRRIGGSGAYAEGWALYTESLGKELGLYTDPYQYLGMLGGEMHRAIRLVVDVGMHAKGWTREQAIQYSKDHEALPEEGIIAEIERYMALPGQALSYKIGQLKIRGLRIKAERELGSRFDIAEFHDQVLNEGSLPLTILEKKINRWIEAKK